MIDRKKMLVSRNVPEQEVKTDPSRVRTLPWNLGPTAIFQARTAQFGTIRGFPLSCIRNFLVFWRA